MSKLYQKKMAATNKNLKQQLKLQLQKFQSDRLRDTYADLMGSGEYQQLGEFFFTDIYGPKDYSQRNNAFKKLAYFLKDAMGKRIFSGIERLIELNDLTEALDQEMVKQLQALGVTDQFTNEQYETAYRNSNNYADRLRQIDLLVTSTAFMHEMSRLSAISLIISGVRLAAVFISANEVMSFLERGYDAFRSTPNIAKFNQIVKARELARHDQLYADQPKRKKR